MEEKEQLKKLSEDFDNLEPEAPLKVSLQGTEFEGVKGDEANSNILNLHKDGEHHGYLDFTRKIAVFFKDNLLVPFEEAIIKLIKSNE